MCIVICTLLLSRPARGAWVEIINLHAVIVIVCNRAPQGARGLKFKALKVIRIPPPSRAPQGARGLKFFQLVASLVKAHVAPRKGRVD